MDAVKLSSTTDLSVAPCRPAVTHASLPHRHRTLSARLSVVSGWAGADSSGAHSSATDRELCAGFRSDASRWYIAAAWAWFGAVSAFSWDLYAPIAGPVTSVFGWSDDEINWLSNGNNLAVVFTSPLWAWLADTKGLRPTAQLASVVFLLSMLCPLLLVPHGLVPARHSLWPAMLSEVLNGAAATAQNFLPPLISAVWFPDSERTTATALMYEANIFGWMLCFVIPPLLVPEHGSLAEQRAGIVLLWEGCAIGGAAFFAAVMLYFPCVFPHRYALVFSS